MAFGLMMKNGGSAKKQNKNHIPIKPDAKRPTIDRTHLPTPSETIALGLVRLRISRAVFVAVMYYQSMYERIYIALSESQKVLKRLYIMCDVTTLDYCNSLLVGISVIERGSVCGYKWFKTIVIEA